MISICMVFIALIFLVILILRMYQYNDDYISTFRLSNDYTEFDAVDLEDVAFLPNLKMRVQNEGDEMRLRNLGIIDLPDKDGNVHYNLDIIRQYVDLVSIVTVRNIKEGVSYNMEFPMITC